MSETTAPAPSKALHRTLWVLQGLLGAAFLLSGLGKALQPFDQIVANPNMAWAAAAGVTQVRVAGISEALGAVGLILPSALRILPILTPVAALGLTTVMGLAANFHVPRGEPIVANLVLGAIALFIAIGRFKLAPIAAK